MNATATKRKVSNKAKSSSTVEKAPFHGAQDRLNYIATEAYYMAEARGFVPGQELDDWLDAEAKFDKMKG